MRRRSAENAGWRSAAKEQIYIQDTNPYNEAGGSVLRDPGVDMSPSIPKHDSLRAVHPMAMLSIFNPLASGLRASEPRSACKSRWDEDRQKILRKPIVISIDGSRINQID
ncbi:Piso0_000707 [Millerozyma farinosa CBS 7064]|uniref:Piso0_000707 protein n=1 Tax=Pichia sorbitophila (strain ATCC MYA-4447 / BCRC 22081 / CBS 7064 / NBRC 10061 / NRRL Y-12695) TaxID=559304 RepID=G8YRA7_PICSO|nr:Piso0_000707 [Millerozyma farinosa CBS 7064]